VQQPVTQPRNGSTPGLQSQLDGQRQKVDVDHFDISIRELVRMAAENELVRAPTYQRKFRWDPEAESRLVESLFLGLPVPSIYVATNPDSSWELVDGLQRVSTLMHYVDDPPGLHRQVSKNAPLRLSGLEKLTAFNNKTFEELPTPLQLAFMKRSLRVTALTEKSEYEVRFDTFERLNTGGIALTPQEVRDCIFPGSFTDMLKELAEYENFRGLLKLRRGSEDDATREELVLKFFAYLNNRDAFDGAVKQFLNNYAKDNADAFPVDEGKQEFRRATDALRAISPGPLLRSGVHVTPQNQFEAILVGAADVLREHGQLGTPRVGWLDDRVLVQNSTAGSNSRNRLMARINRAKELLLGAN
jgi:hypothetical protein